MCSTPKYWITLTRDFNNQSNDNDVLKLNNVSFDFVKAFYCILYNVYPYRDLITYKKIIKTNAINRFTNFEAVEMRNYIDPDHIKVLKINELNCEFEYIDEKFSEWSHRLCVLNDPNTHNTIWKKFIRNINEYDLAQNISKRYAALVCIDEYYHIIQSDSIDIFNGLDFFCSWINLTKRSKSQIIHVYDSWKVCKILVTYDVPEKEKNNILYVFECLNKYLLNDVTALVMKLVTKCCDSTYDECQTPTLDFLCHNHQYFSIDDVNKLKYHMADIKLEQL